MRQVIVLHFFACSFMTGIIWLVQILVYPNFRLLAESNFVKFHEFHTNRITWVVAPVMLLELSTGIWLAYTESHIFFLWNLISILGVWALTGLVSVPQHNLLQRKPETSKDGMIWSNWPRTLVWTARVCGLIWMMDLTLAGALQ